VVTQFKSPAGQCGDIDVLETIFTEYRRAGLECRYARPGEMNDATASAEKLAALPPDVASITVSLEVSRDAER
jgi:hypothetical protein